MGEYEKVYEHIMFRRSDSNVSFAGLCALLKTLGFDERIKGDHHIFTMSDVEEILNLQPKQAFDSESDMRGSRSAQVRRFRVVRGSIRVGMCCTWIHHLVLTQ